MLDASHGGQDVGARLADNLLEKDVTLAFAQRLRSLLQARGFTVVLTRESDSLTTDTNPAPLTLDSRAGIANHARPAACLLLHATGSGHGMHLYTSELAPTNGELPTPQWLTAQSAWVSQSKTLADNFKESLTRAKVPLVESTASIRPVDSLTCPAVVLELAPKSTGDAASISDSEYQQRVAESVAGVLTLWRNQVQPPAHLNPEPTLSKGLVSQ